MRANTILHIVAWAFVALIVWSCTGGARAAGAGTLPPISATGQAEATAAPTATRMRIVDWPAAPEPTRLQALYLPHLCHQHPVAAGGSTLPKGGHAD